MRKLFMLFIAFFYSLQVNAAPLKQMIFFGDSLSDNGNLYRTTHGIMPKSPPYYQGRFSNGPTWAEDVGKNYYDKYYTGYKNYAVAGATTILHKPTKEFVAPSTLELQMDKYFIESIFEKERGQILYSIWTGANDYLYDKSLEPDYFTTKVVEKISWAITTLINKGAKNFLILNLPDLSRIPYAASTSMRERYHLLSESHNQKLARTIQELQAKYPDVKFMTIDIYGFFNDALDHTDKYNQKYHVNITNITEACWPGGYRLGNMSHTPKADDLKKILEQNGENSADVNTQALSEYVAESPALMEAYEVGINADEGYVPCTNPTERLFWDQMHPTGTVHGVLAQIVEELIDPVMQG